MDLEQSVISYDILGYKVKLSSQDDSLVTAEEVVNMVKGHTDLITSECPGLDRGEVALLAALSIAKEKLSISKEYKENISDLQQTASTALDLIEDVSPTTV